MPVAGEEGDQLVMQLAADIEPDVDDRGFGLAVPAEQFVRHLLHFRVLHGRNMDIAQPALGKFSTRARRWSIQRR